MRLLITGSRDWQDEAPIRAALARARPEVVIHGAARGADALAGRIAAEIGCLVLPFPAAWGLGRAAGVLRNQRMLDEGRPGWVIAFADDLLASRGTRDMVERSVEDPAVTHVYHYSSVVGWRTVKMSGRRPRYGRTHSRCTGAVIGGCWISGVHKRDGDRGAALAEIDRARAGRHRFGVLMAAMPPG